MCAMLKVFQFLLLVFTVLSSKKCVSKRSQILELWLWTCTIFSRHFSKNWETSNSDVAYVIFLKKNIYYIMANKITLCIFLKIYLSILFIFFTGWALSTDPLDLDISYRIHYKHQQFTDVKTISQSDPAYILKVTKSFWNIHLHS